MDCPTQLRLFWEARVFSEDDELHLADNEPRRRPSYLMRLAASRNYPWYDSWWLDQYATAIRTMRDEAPHRVEEFQRAFDVLRTDDGFTVRKLPRVFDDATMEAIRHACVGLEPRHLELHEVRNFRRFVVHDHPLFNELHRRITALASEAAGEALEPSYNFLSLYGHDGVCPLHLDSPRAKYTLDLCVSQSVPWPINFSPPVQWPTPGLYGPDWEDAIKREQAGRFTAVSLEPGQSILFSGSSQWHYRDRMPVASTKAQCDLLFFHFIPRGTKNLVDPLQWASTFTEPALMGFGRRRNDPEAADQ